MLGPSGLDLSARDRRPTQAQDYYWPAWLQWGLLLERQGKRKAANATLRRALTIKSLPKRYRSFIEQKLGQLER